MPDFVPEFVLVLVPDGCRREFEPNIEGVKLGHQLGLENLHNILEYARDLGISHAAVWGASESNLRNRKPLEVEHLFELFEADLERQLTNRDARIYVRGRWPRYVPSSKSVQRLKSLVKEVEQATSKILDRHLTVLFGYDGRMEIAASTIAIASNGVWLSKQVDEVWDMQRRVCWTSHIPAGNLYIIRTGIDGDSHESDLLLPFQRQNAEYYTTPVCWPFFTREHLDKALEDFGTRRRMLGK